jgi:hypothetical protein
LLVVVALPGAANVAWIESHEDLIQKADAVVLGTASAVHAVVAGHRIEYTAELDVSEVLAGTLSPGLRVNVLWTNQVGVVCPRLNRDLLPGVKSFWWLNARGDAFEATSVNSVTPVFEAQNIVAELSRLVAPSERVRAVLERARSARSSQSSIRPP